MIKNSSAAKTQNSMEHGVSLKRLLHRGPLYPGVLVAVAEKKAKGGGKCL